MFILWKFYAYVLYRISNRPQYFQVYLEICRLLKAGSYLLHVGCGVRVFEEFLSHDHSNVIVEAVDFDRRLIYSRFKYFDNQNQYNKDLDLGFRYDQGRTFDLVFLEQAFAGIPHDHFHFHVDDMRRLLKDGGELVAIVASRPAPPWLRSLRWMLDIPQVPYFDRDTLCHLFKTNRVFRIECEPFWIVKATVHHNQRKTEFIERRTTCECKEMRTNHFHQ